MGKSAVTQFLRRNKFPVFDADSEVHKLYTKNKNIHEKISSICPACMDITGINREKLSQHITNFPQDLQRIERTIQPELAKAFKAFYYLNNKHRKRIIFIDAPLLIESNYWRLCDVILTLSAPKLIQIRRIYARPSSSQAKVELLISRQLQDEARRARSDIIVPTGLGHSYTRRYISCRLKHLQGSWRTLSEAPYKVKHGVPSHFPRRVGIKQGLVPGSRALKKYLYATKTKGKKA